MTPKERADRLLVARGLFESRARAQAAIAAGRVTADGIVVRKASDAIASAAIIAAAPEHPYVSRGGVKLAAALDHFGLDVAGRVCLDVGASTGGFTDVLLARGARRVYAVDVGTTQLHPRLRGRDDVVCLEQTDIRKLAPAALAELPDIAVIDVSFISLKLVLPAAGNLLAPRAHMLALIKPQFEAKGQGFKEAMKKGIVRDDRARQAICDDIAAWLTALGWGVGGVVAAAIRGGGGNQEFFIAAERD